MQWHAQGTQSVVVTSPTSYIYIILETLLPNYYVIHGSSSGRMKYCNVDVTG